MNTPDNDTTCVTERFWVTFGSAFDDGEHEYLGHIPRLSNSYMTVDAEDHLQARDVVRWLMSTDFSHMYRKPEFDKWLAKHPSAECVLDIRASEVLA